MFDAPDLGPLCLAPFVGLATGAILYGLIHVVARRPLRRRWIVATIPAIVVVPVAAFASFTLRIGESDPTPWLHPGHQDVIGTWHLTNDTVAGLRLIEGYTAPPHYLTFNEDGTFAMSKVPNFWITLRDAAPNDPSEITAEGSWAIPSEYDHPIILLTFEAINLEASAGAVMPLYFEGHLPPYRLVARGLAPLNPMFRFSRE